MKNVIIDFEFTGLDNNFITDNEIIWMSFLDIETKEKNSFIFDSKKENWIWSFLVNEITREKQNWKEFFSKEFFEKIFWKDFENIKFVWFWNKSDEKMLKKYWISISIIDIQDNLRKMVEYEEQLASNGSSLETCYFIVLWKRLKHKHTSTFEVESMFKIFKKMFKNMVKEYLEYVPYWPFAGMLIEDFVLENRKMADGYRYNNSDSYAESLDHHIYLNEESDDDDDDDDDDDY